ncbi:MAG: prepilin-type N-terminal cleavage/methylation domain-containing protein [Verrucomicrobiota bacterium]
MFIERQQKSRGGFTLVEVMVATGLFGVASLALCSVYLFSTTSFAALVNYAELDKINRTAMDTMTKEIRAAQAVTAATPSSFTIINGDGVNVNYSFNPLSGKLQRTPAGGSPQTLLSDCTLLAFNLYQRNPVGGTYDIYPAATNNWAATVKCVSLTWKASRQMPGGNSVSENIQTARVVMRNQQITH